MGESTARIHIPVMRDAVVEILRCRSGAVYVDGTVGGGGYAEKILEASDPDGVLIALDCDAEAVDRARNRLSSYGGRLLVEHANFTELPAILRKHGCETVDGIVVDLGLSTHQLTDPLRGFSFALEGPLDMRMDKRIRTTAADLVNSLPVDSLARLILQFGEERRAVSIARAIVDRRKERSFQSTRELADLIAGVVPRTRDSIRIHPATRTFQALRIAVNGELDSLERFLPKALEVLKPGGRLCTVAFHSLEDRLIKNVFKEWSRSCACPKGFPECRCNTKSRVRVLTKKPVRPGAEEIAGNPSARSARLRAVEKTVE